MSELNDTKVRICTVMLNGIQYRMFIKADSITRAIGVARTCAGASKLAGVELEVVPVIATASGSNVTALR